MVVHWEFRASTNELWLYEDYDGALFLSKIVHDVPSISEAKQIVKEFTCKKRRKSDGRND